MSHYSLGIQSAHRTLKRVLLSVFIFKRQLSCKRLLLSAQGKCFNDVNKL